MKLTTHRDWPGLPYDLLSSITDRLHIDDYVRFGAVCTAWRSVFLQEINSSLQRRPPFLLVAPPPPAEQGHDQRALYSMSNDEVYGFRLPVPHLKDCRGSSFGWLVTIETKGEGEARHDCQVQLLNPFLNRVIRLPPLDDIARQHPEDGSYNWEPPYLVKAVLSCNPCSDADFVVVAIMSRYHGLAFFRPGSGAAWTSVGDDWCGDFRQNRAVVDVIFSHRTNLFYALHANRSITAIDLLEEETSNPKLTKVAILPKSPYGFPKYLVEHCPYSFPKDLVEHYPYSVPKYLVEDLSSSDLFLVFKRAYSDDADIFFDEELFLNELFEAPIVQFNVFRLSASCGIWTEVDNLGDNIMFLGRNGSILRSAADCPGCKPNCIYYTNDENGLDRYNSDSYGVPSDGIYDLKDATVGSHYSSARPAYTRPRITVERSSPTQVLPQPIWIEPTLKGRAATDDKK